MGWKLFALLAMVCAVAPAFLAKDAIGQPPPPKGPPPPPPNAPPMGPQQGPPQGGSPQGGATIAQVGKAIFFDTTLSNPAGLACASCHAPQTGFTYPISNVNAQTGIAQGAVAGRFGNRKPPTVSYASFSPKGPVFNNNAKAYIGGQFWDGRAADLASQAQGPLFNPNEMNNIVNNVAAPQLVVQAIAKGPYAQAFQQVFGANVFSQPPQQVVLLVAQAVAAWEATPEISPFSSKYDLVQAGQAQFSPAELAGLQLVTGSTSGRPGGPPNYKNAGCAQCHGIPAAAGNGPDLWTFYSFANTGVPRNANNPYYAQTNATTNPLGVNLLGNAYVDFGLGDYLYPANNLPIANQGNGSNGQGDFLAINGTFKVPTLRNVDKRPSPNFVKAYGHNGVFKSLQQVVHFYNTRNLTTSPGEVIDFTRANPYAGLTGQPLWPPPEVPSPITMRNPRGLVGQIGNLGLTPQEEGNIVAFLQTLSDAGPPLGP